MNDVNPEYLEKIKEFPHIEYEFQKISVEVSKAKALHFYETMNSRRSVRFFSDEAIPLEIIENVIKTAGTAPSGAHKQPWTFVVVTDPEIKKKIRIAAEEEERKNYSGRLNDEWLNDLAPLGTTWEKPFLETASYLIVAFKQRYGVGEDGSHKKHYYVSESVGIAVGFLIAAIHQAGLVTLTHTPSPMNFLSKILERPENEVPFILLPVGYPAKNATVPDLKRKYLSNIMILK
ncbi:MAG: nitroreductase family protein [Candidatus Kariarchaeaceae archaeon]